MPTSTSDSRRARHAPLVAASVAALSLAVSGARASDAPSLVQLLSQGPWSAVSGLVGYRGRVWYVNGEKSVNHNAADLYSYDPASGASRYERALFSQDAGEPLVAFVHPPRLADRQSWIVVNLGCTQVYGTAVQSR